MELVGLPDVDKTNESGIEVTPQSGSLTLTNKVEMILAKLKRMRLESNKKDKDSMARPSNETVLHVIRILLAATQLWGREYNQGKQAVMTADLAVGLADIMDDDDDSDTADIGRGDASGDAIVVECHRARGVSYGLLASQCKGEKKEEAKRHIH